MRHGGRITAKRSGRIKKISFFYPAGVSPILPARFERILALFPILLYGQDLSRASSCNRPGEKSEIST